MNRLRYPLFAAMLGIALWQTVVWTTNAPHFILPSPWRVAKTGYEYRDLIVQHALITATEVVVGLLIGAILGAITAVQLAAAPRLAKLVLPILVFTQAVPVFALAPILTLWFGYGMASKIVMAVLIIYFPVTSSFYDGLTRVTPALLDLAKTMGALDRQVMLRVKIPHALPSLGSGLKLAAVYAPIGAVIGEWVGSSQGLGYLMLLANGRAKIDLMFASLIALAVLTVTLHLLVSALVNRMNTISHATRA